MHINEANDKIIKDVFKNFYIIPRFQRPYSWQKEEVEELLNDIIENEENYFIGSIVTYKSNGDFKGIVDGQQRLTTLILVLSAVKYIATDLLNNDLAEGTSIYLERKNDINKNTPTINTETSYPTYQKIITGEYLNQELNPVCLEEKQILEIFEFIKCYINKYLDSFVSKMTNLERKNEVKNGKLLALRNKILNLVVIYIELDDEDDAYTIFETLNTRGMDLSNEDLIKNYVMQKLDTRSSVLDTPKDNWNNLAQYITNSKDSLSSFLLYQWISHNGVCAQKDLFKNIRKKYNSKQSVKKYIENLESDKIAFRYIRTQNSAKELGLNDKKIFCSLQALSMFKVKQHTSAIMLVIREYKNQKISLKQLQQFITKIEKFHFKYNTITSSRTSATSSVYKNFIAKYNKLVDDSNIKNQYIRDFKFPSELIPSKEDFISNFKKIYFINDYTKYKKIIRYILEKIENYHITHTVPIAYDQYTIEHLIPQDKIGKFSELEIGQIGNLIFVTKDVQDKLKNKTLKDKLQILTELEIQIPFNNFESEYDKCTNEIDLINERTNLIAIAAYENIWH